MSKNKIDADGFKAYLDALNVTLAEGGNEAKKHLLRLLVEKVIVHDRGHVECWFKLPDGSTVQNALENAKTGEANSCSNNELTAPVCNHDNAAPRTVVIANRAESAVVMIADLTYNGKPSRRKFLREGIKISVRRLYGQEPQVMGDIEDGVSHFLCRGRQIWLPRQRYDRTLEEKRNKRRLTAQQWIQGLADGRYRNRADIARAGGCSRSWISQTLRSQS